MFFPPGAGPRSCQLSCGGNNKKCYNFETKYPMTTISLDEKQFKVLLKQTLIELFEERQDIFSAIVAEALEEIGLANAIREGRKDDYMLKEKIGTILAV
jgi:hypothetical protein